jgi:hypothetical protein
MRPAGAEGDAEVAALEELTALEELVAAVVAVLAVVIPALHAARDKLAAQAARATAAGRYLFIVVLKGRKRCAALNLDRRDARRMANVSQACDTQRNPGTDQVSETDAAPLSRVPSPE